MSRITHETDIGVIVFARAPVPGGCKTRLARGCHPVRAARLYRAMLEHAVSAVAARAPGRVTLACAPSTGHPLFKRLARRYGLTLAAQSSGDLGRRMHAALRQTLGTHPAALLVGSDQPLLDDDWFDDARSALMRPDAAWLAPTRDGGYWAIGLSRADGRIFQGPDWGTSRVARQTRRRCARAGLHLREWHERSDIDTWRDWCACDSSTRSAIARGATTPGLFGFRGIAQRFG